MVGSTGRAIFRQGNCLAVCTLLLLLCSSGDAQQIIADKIELNGGAIRVQGAVRINGALINGRVDASPPVPEEKVEPGEDDGPHTLELTDGSTMHGEIVSLGKSEVVWKRAGASESLIFSPADVRRMVFGSRMDTKSAGGNTTLKFPGGDWVVGKVNAFADGKFALEIGEGPTVQVEKKRVDWVVFSPTLPPDAFEGPRGAVGLSGWEFPTPGAWDYAEESLIARQSVPLMRKFDSFPERMDIQFAAGDGGNANRGLTLWLQPQGRTTGYSAGSIFLRFQTNTITLNSYDGSNMKNETVTFEQDAANRDKVSRYRLLYDRKSGNLLIRVNGARAAGFRVPAVEDSTSGGSLIFQPSYWNSEVAWTLSGVKVQPWDGDELPDGEPEHVGKDLIKTASLLRKAGTFEGLTADAVKFSGADVSRKEPVFLRFGRKESEPSPAVAARVWLAHRGEFDVSALGYKDGVLKVRTAFAGELELPAKALHAVEFPVRKPVTEPPVAGNDTLIFRNGDQLKGTLVFAADDQKLRWKPQKGGAEVQFEPRLISGVQLAPREPKAVQAPLPFVIRWANGDWLPGSLVAYSDGFFQMKTALGEQTQIGRMALSALYLGGEAGPAVYDGAVGVDTWLGGAAAPGFLNSNRSDKKEGKKPSPWRYFDGAYTLAQNTRSTMSGGTNIGRSFESLPDKCEVSFEVSVSRGAASNVAIVSQLFFDENKGGIMVQSSGDFAYLYDMSPRAGRVAGNQQQQIEFGSGGHDSAPTRRFSFFCDRTTGRFHMAVNGRTVGQIVRKNSADSPKPGRGISISPNVMGARVSLTNVWVGPWSGQLPPAAEKVKAKEDAQDLVPPGTPTAVAPEKKEPAEVSEERESPQDAVALANGDETGGTLMKATENALFLDCPVGELEIPMKRATMVQFAPTAAPELPGVRLRLAGNGAVTAEKFRFENGRAKCRSSRTGEWELPAESISEISFAPGARSPFERQSAGKNSDAAPDSLLQGGNIIIRNGFRIEIAD